MLGLWGNWPDVTHVDRGGKWMHLFRVLEDEMNKAINFPISSFHNRWKKNNGDTYIQETHVKKKLELIKSLVKK